MAFDIRSFIDNFLITIGLQETISNTTDIQIISFEDFIRHQLLTGVNPEILKQQLITELRTGEGTIFAPVRNMLNQQASNIIQKAEINSELRFFIEEEGDPLLSWTLESTNPCPDCKARSGLVMRASEWVGQGPNEVWTMCQNNNGCYCSLSLI